MNSKIYRLLAEEGVDDDIVEGAHAFAKSNDVDPRFSDRIPEPEYFYYGREVWEKALAVLLAGKNLLLTGPKATGKNVLAENLAEALGRPVWNVSFHINVDAAYLIGVDTYDGTRVTFRPGPVWMTAKNGGMCVLDEINMAKNEALAVMHSVLDFRFEIDVPGYSMIKAAPASRYVATMNYGYAGTRELNEALCSRFAVLDMPLIEESDLVKLISRKFPTIKVAMRDQLIRLFYELQKKAENAEISERAVDLRGILDAIGLVSQGLTTGQALEMCVTGKTFDRYEQQLIRDTVAARIPQDIKSAEMFES